MKKYLLTGLSQAEVRWSMSYVCLSWFAELGNGAIQTITGPMQPFLAYNLQTDTQTINLVWTLGFLGFLVGSLITSHIFTRCLNTSAKKLLFMSAVMFITGLATLCLPFIMNLPLLLIARFIQFLGYGLFLTADSIVLVFTLGPEGSRPFMQALHFFVSIGFLTGTFLVQPFLPSKRELVCMLESKTNTTTDVTPSGSNDEISNQPQEELVIPQLYGIQTICWPFIISGVWCTLVAIGYIVLTLRRSLVMPQFYDENTNTKHKEFGPKKLSYVWKRIFLALVLQFFAFSGALIRVFQSMSTTFSMCGPLQLETHRAALTDTFYSSGMCLGRLTSTFLSTIILPSKLVILSMMGCIISTFLLIFLAPLYYISLYIGVFIMGFFLSWQFASAFSWTSHHMNITGKLSSIFFIGLGIGSLSSPPLAGWMFMLSPMFVIYTVGVMVLCQSAAVACMWLVSNRK